VGKKTIARIGLFLLHIPPVKKMARDLNGQKVRTFKLGSENVPFVLDLVLIIVFD